MKISVVNPLTKEPLYDMDQLSEEEISGLFDKSRYIQQRISAMTLCERAEEARKIVEFLIKNHKMVTARIASETGKTKFDVLHDEIFETCKYMDHYCRSSSRAIWKKRMLKYGLFGSDLKFRNSPMGVLLIIGSYSNPLKHFFLYSLHAFLFGNAVIYKPSEFSPLHGLFEEIMESSGFIKEAIQIAYGNKSILTSLIDQGPDKIHFIGSRSEGKYVMSKAAKHLIPVDLEVVNKSKAVVFEDGNIESAANALVWAAFANAGQSPDSLGSCFVHERIFNSLSTKIVELTGKLKLRNHHCEDCDADVGCITVNHQFKELKNQLRKAVEKGASILCGGQDIEGTQIFLPTVITAITPDTELKLEQIVGPVLFLVKFSSDEEAVSIINRGGNTNVSLWVKNLKRAKRVASALNTQNICVNCHRSSKNKFITSFGKLIAYKSASGAFPSSTKKSVFYGPASNLIKPYWYPYTSAKFEIFSAWLNVCFTKPRNWVQYVRLRKELNKIGYMEKLT